MFAYNLFQQVPEAVRDEFVEVLASGNNVRIERIVSQGHSSPVGFWYDQDQSEWVVVLQGEAKLLIEGSSGPMHLVPGDHLLIPAHQKHRVEWTSPNKPTIWLAVFFG
jgi:cupin 2 domain-containing protein